MTVNEPLFRQIVEHIENNPDEWNQSVFGSSTECQTTYCLAGWACVFSGEELQWKEYDSEIHDVSEGKYLATAWAMRTGTEALGLTYHQADELFHNYTSDIDEFKSDITRVTGIKFKAGVEK